MSMVSNAADKSSSTIIDRRLSSAALYTSFSIRRMAVSVENPRL
jgi:hypothetical protein